MAGPVAQGGTIVLDAVFRSGDLGGQLVDPPDPLVDILNPAAAVVANNQAPARIAEGTYIFAFDVPADAPLGRWTARWTGTVDAALLTGFDYFDVVAPGEVGTTFDDYGATTGGVLAYVPELRLDPAAPAVIAKIATFLDAVSPQVSAAVGAGLSELDDLGDPDATAAALVLRGQARGVVQMGAASLLQDSSYPELAATDNTDQHWGAALWEHFKEALAALEANLAGTLERFRLDLETGELVGPAVSSPPPTFTSTMRF